MNSMRLTAVFFASILPEMVCQIATSSDLNCGFEGTCRWRNASVGEDSGDFLITNNIKMEGHFNIIPSKNVPEEVFAYTKGLFDGAQKAILISDVISCQLGGGSLTIWYYRTGESAALEVCIRQPPGSMNTADLRCFPVFSQSLANQWLFHTVDFPPLTQPFELLISSSFVQPFDIIAIDDIYYDAALCENVNSRSTEGAGGKFALLSDTEDGLLGNIVDGIGLVGKNTIPQFINQNQTRSLLPLYASPGSRRPAVKLQRGRTSATWAPRCLFTDCSFDAVSMCLYKSTEQLQDDEDLLLDLPSHSVLKKWELSNHKVGNSLTGIMGDFNGDGWFAYAGKTKNPATMFLMHTSQAVFIPEESKIDFLLHMTGKYGRLRVCLDSLQKCPFKRTGQQLSMKTRTWTNFHFNISRGFHTIYFVADHLKKNYVIGLDEIRLLNRYGNASAPCM